MDSQIKAIDSTDISADMLINDLFKAKDPISEYIFKQEIKQSSIQETIQKFSDVKQIDNLDDWLKGIRELSRKQFKSIYKLKKAAKVMYVNPDAYQM
mmetsp:Transcript_12344/g.20749  ORF Transcript_12344/g.20749 Transcript_12344/m.20749 type:complete len:97 (+) Transcript_12344:338-628(+)